MARGSTSPGSSGFSAGDSTPPLNGTAARRSDIDDALAEMAERNEGGQNW